MYKPIKRHTDWKRNEKALYISQNMYNIRDMPCVAIGTLKQNDTFEHERTDLDFFVLNV